MVALINNFGFKAHHVVATEALDACDTELTGQHITGDDRSLKLEPLVTMHNSREVNL